MVLPSPRFSQDVSNDQHVLNYIDYCHKTEKREDNLIKAYKTVNMQLNTENNIQKCSTPLVAKGSAQ